MICLRYYLIKVCISSNAKSIISWPRKISSCTPTSVSAASHSNSSNQSVTGSSATGNDTSLIFPISISPAGVPLRGLNYLKGREDPISLKEEEYPTWLWTLLDKKKKDESIEDEDSDLFSKSKKLRRKAAKKRRKMEALKLASGNITEVKVPLTQQSIDLPSNEEETLSGAIKASDSRRELRIAMRNERRNAIKEKNYLKSV